MTKFLMLGLIAAIAVPAAAQQKAISRADFIAQTNASFNANDTNHDGFISVSEMQAAQAHDLQRLQASARASFEAQFRQLDTNHDGQLSLAEFEALATVKANQTPQQLVEMLDTNHDGKVSPEEFRAAKMKQFNLLDTNHDGIVSPAEMQAAAGKK